MKVIVVMGELSKLKAVGKSRRDDLFIEAIQVHYQAP
jgi:hypothetical protein